jgi:hypothetical protein
MSDTTLNRIGGGVLAAGGTISAVGFLLGTVDQPGAAMTPAYVDSPLYLVFNLMELFGAALVLVGLPAVIARHWRTSPGLTLAGSVGVGLVMVVQGIGNGFLNAAVLPALIDDPTTRVFASGAAPATMAPLFLLGMAGFILGGPLLGIGVLRGGVVHRWIGVALIAAAMLSIVSLVLPSVFESLGAIVAMVTLAALGAELLAPERIPAARIPAPSVA